MKIDCYGVPLFLIKEYLRNLGGREVCENTFGGDGWTVVVCRAPWRAVGSLRVGGTTAAFSGDQAAIESLLNEHGKRTQRAGG